MEFDSDIPLESQATVPSEGSFGAADDAALSGAASEVDDGRLDGGGSQKAPTDGNSAKSKRSRGSRGSGRSAAAGSGGNKKWRSGAIPNPPTFDGDIDVDPFCLRHYRKRLHRWTITRDFLPGNEQALRAREQLKGEAELELAEVADSRYDVADGISILLKDLEESFGERPLFRQGGVIREYESVGRLQGESVSQFCRRFRLLEGRLKDGGVPPYPEESRVVKLLDGLRLDERATASLLLASGNKYTT